MSLLYLDLETTPYEEAITNQEFFSAVPANYKKPESIEKYVKEHKKAIRSKIFKKRSLDPFQCKIVCLSYSFNGEKVEAITGTEKILLEIFQIRINNHLKDTGGSVTGITLVGHNIKRFDAPILYLRAAKYKLDSLLQLLYFTRKSIVDTMEMGTYFTYGATVSLDTLCQFFNVPTPKGELDGSKVYEYYLAGKIKEIAKYCNGDVEALISVHEHLAV